LGELFWCLRCSELIFVGSAGVIGLDVALLLAERGYGSQLTILAEHMPGDTSINYTSPWYVNPINFSAW
jgi:D-amino-acid oxidase